MVGWGGRIRTSDWLIQNLASAISTLRAELSTNANGERSQTDRVLVARSEWGVSRPGR